MFFLPLFAAVSLVSAQSTLPVGIDPRCKKMDAEQWNGFAKKEAVRQRAFASLGLPNDRPYTEVLFGHETKQELNGNWFCAEGWNTVVDPAKELKCNVQKTSLIDKSNNAPGIVTINVQSGTTASTTLTETDSSATAAGVTLKMSGKIPLVGGVETTISFTETYTKTFSKAQTFTTNTLTSITRSINIGPNNSKCQATLSMTTCQHEANGRYPLIALGWVGWRLKDEYTFKGETARRWYVFIDGFPRADREDFGRFNAGIGSETYATIVSQCDAATTKIIQEAANRNATRVRHRMRDEVPNHPNRQESPEAMLARATAGLPEELKHKVITQGDYFFLPVADK